jgi:SAM-dependent methyltransferase
VLSLGSMPLANSLPTPEDLLVPEPRYPLELAVCAGCALVQITRTVAPEELFSEYAYFSSYSSTLVERAEALVARMIEERGLGTDSLVVEVASNDGYLLQHYVMRGVPTLGIDPARNVAEAAQARGVSTLCEFFGLPVAERLRGEGRRADVIHANNVLAHVPEVNGFVSAIARLLADQGTVVIETPYVVDLLDKLEFDTIYHEHVFYYSLTALRNIFQSNGLVLVDVEHVDVHGGSLRAFAQLPGAAQPHDSVSQFLAAEHRRGIGDVAYYRGFSDRVIALGRELRDLLSSLKAEGHRIAAYGAAAKGAVLLNAFGIGPAELDFVADRNPYKQGRVMPGVHVPIVGPERLLEDMPDYVLLLAWNLEQEVLAQEADYCTRGGRFIVPIPKPRVV